jgi:hypothetical protein
MRIKEFSLHSTVSKTIQEHIERGVPFTECLFRPGSKAFTEFYSQVRQLYNEGKIELDWQDQELLETDIGQCIVVEGETFSLDVPIEIAEEVEVDEAYESPLDSPGATAAREKLQKTLKDIKKKDPDHPAVQNVKDEDADAVRELVLYADNTGSLYPQKESIMKNLTRKWRKGVYDSELAAKLWLYWATAAAKSYAQEFGYAFSVQDRKAAAKEFEENWRAELEAGNAMESVQEGVEMCPEACCGKPVTECECGPDCEHCDCYEKNKSLSEADYRGKNVELNKPKRGGSKKFYVYVKNPKTGNIKKVSFGAKGMSVKTDDPERVRNFVARHDCKNRNDKTTASYWSCRLPRYKSLGIKGGQWW